MELLPAAFAAMASYHQFIVYVLQPDQHRPGKMDKLPRDHRTGATVDAHDALYWTDFETAAAAARRFGAGHGVGFVLTEDDPFWCLDIDNALVDATGQWSPLANELCIRLAGCAIEISSSKRGLHIFGSDMLPIGHKTRNGAAGLELYTTRRFIALTGTAAVGNAGHRAGQAIMDVVTQFFPGDNIDTHMNWTDRPIDGCEPIADDSELIERACRSRSTQSLFSGKAAFVDLWEGNETALAVTYPSANGGYDASAADLALAQHLAFWTGKDCERIKRLMLQSGLFRSKYQREGYLAGTIIAACARVSATYTAPKGAEIPATDVVKHGFQPRNVRNILNAAEQIALFQGCVYVIDEHKVFTPQGVLLKPEQFKAIYGGSAFQMDVAGSRVTRKAFEAFTESEHFVCPRAHSTCFRPDLPTGEIITQEGRQYVNTYVPVPIVRMPGNTEPFHIHLEKLLPHDVEARKHLFYYLCAIIQHPGVKFQWAPFIQGVEGNGKSFISLVIEYAIGARYCQRPRASEINSRFNDWTYGAIFATIEDMSMSDRSDELLEFMKPLITNSRQEIEAKGQGRVMRDICINFIINSNHKGGYRKTSNDRRVCPFFTAQQSADDLIAHGMTEVYFLNLFQWAKNGGYAAMAHELYTTPIPDEYNPAVGSIRAPKTSSTEEAISLGGGRIEEEIYEAIGDAEMGFRGGFISIHFLKELLMKHRIGCSPHRRKALLSQMGYIPHPAFAANDHRAFRAMQPDGRRSVLFVRKDHATVTNNASALDVILAYEAAHKDV